jgi:hypothetical protein
VSSHIFAEKSCESSGPLSFNNLIHSESEVGDEVALPQTFRTAEGLKAIQYSDDLELQDLSETQRSSLAIETDLKLVPFQIRQLISEVFRRSQYF